MKKILMIAAAGLLSIGAMAQYRSGIIVSAGYQGANIKVNQDNSGNKMKSGFRAGVAVDLPVYDFGAGVLSIQPGLYYSMKGTKSQTTIASVTGMATTTLGYIEMPILANASFSVSDGLSVFVNAGPYLAYGVNSSRRVKAEGKIINADSGEKSANLFKKDKNGNSIINPFDAGLQVGAGVEYQRVQLGVGAQFGFVNMTKTDKIKSTNSAFFVTLGYRF